jgi:hypothetical protein
MAKPITASAAKKSKLAFSTVVNLADKDAIYALRAKGADVSRLTREVLADGAISPDGRKRLATVLASAGFISEASRLDPPEVEIPEAPTVTSGKSKKA